MLISLIIVCVINLYFSSDKQRKWINMSWYIIYESQVVCYVIPPRLLSLIGCFTVLMHGYGVLIFNKTAVMSVEWGEGGGVLDNVPVLDRHSLFIVIQILSYVSFGLYVGWLIFFFRRLDSTKADKVLPSSINDASTSKCHTAVSTQPNYQIIIKRRRAVEIAFILLITSTILISVGAVVCFLVTYVSLMFMIPYLLWNLYLSMLTASYFLCLNSPKPILNST